MYKLMYAKMRADSWEVGPWIEFDEYDTEAEAIQALAENVADDLKHGSLFAYFIEEEP